MQTEYSGVHTWKAKRDSELASNGALQAKERHKISQLLSVGMYYGECSLDRCTLTFGTSKARGSWPFLGVAGSVGKTPVCPSNPALLRSRAAHVRTSNVSTSTIHAAK